MDSRVGARDSVTHPRVPYPGFSGETSCRLGALPCAQLRPQSLFLLPQLGRELLAEILGLEDRPDLDLDSPPIGLGQRLTHSIASSSDSTCQIQ